MNEKFVKFTKIDKNAVIPMRYSEGAAGYDLCSIEEGIIKPNELLVVRTGMFVEFENDLMPICFSRSGLSFKNGIETVYGNVEIRKEIKLNLFNNCLKEFKVEKGMRVSQMVFIKRSDRLINED